MDKMIDPLLVVFCFIFLVTVGCLISYSEIKDIIRIHRTPRIAIDALPPAGSFEVVGKAQGEPVISPISETRCAFWQVEVKEKRRGSKGGVYWETIYRDSSQEPFEIKDETGNIKISPQRAKLMLKDNLEDSSGVFNEKLERMNINTKTEKDWGSNKSSNKSLTVYERLIKAGERIYVLAEIQETDKINSFAERILPHFISVRSERELLDTLYWQVGTKVFLALLIGGGLIMVALQGKVNDPYK